MHDGATDLKIRNARSSFYFRSVDGALLQFDLIRNNKPTSTSVYNWINFFFFFLLKRKRVIQWTINMYKWSYQVVIVFIENPLIKVWSG